jgi:hypothetical protein
MQVSLIPLWFGVLGSMSPSPSREDSLSSPIRGVLRREEFPSISEGMIPNSHPGCSKDHAQGAPKVLLQ